MNNHLSVFVFYPGKFNSVSDENIKMYFKILNEKYASFFYNNMQEFDWNSIFSNDISTFTFNFLKNTNHLYCNTIPLYTRFIPKKPLSHG